MPKFVCFFLKSGSLCVFSRKSLIITWNLSFSLKLFKMEDFPTQQTPQRDMCGAVVCGAVGCGAAACTMSCEYVL